MGRQLPARLRNWLPRLNDYLRRVGPFDPVGHNCAHFILGAIGAVTGQDVATALEIAGVSEIPDTQIGIARLLSSRGDMAGIAQDYFGAPPRTDTAMAQRGDIAILAGSTGDTLGVFDAAGIVALSERGLVRHQRSSALGYWKV